MLRYLKLLPVLTTLGLAGFSYIQTERLSATRDNLETVTADRDKKNVSLGFYMTALEIRDGVIKSQSASIDKLSDTANANRDAYRAALAEARTRSALHDDVAEELLSLKSPEGELEQCRAARDLLEQELVR